VYLTIEISGYETYFDYSTSSGRRHNGIVPLHQFKSESLFLGVAFSALPGVFGTLVGPSFFGVTSAIGGSGKTKKYRPKFWRARFVAASKCHFLFFHPTIPCYD
jgi:hypothetical protein